MLQKQKPKNSINSMLVWRWINVYYVLYCLGIVKKVPEYSKIVYV